VGLSRKYGLQFDGMGKNLIAFNGTRDVVRYLSGMKPTKLFKKTPNKERRPAVKKRAADIRAEYQQARERLVFGSLGAASPVRRIDPKTGDVVAVIDPKSGAIHPTKTRKR
jgi:hypothetical protein